MVVQVDEFSFNNGSIDVIIRVYIDTATELVSYRSWDVTSGVEIEITFDFGTITEEQRGTGLGIIVYSACIGFDYWVISALLEEPFGLVDSVTRNTTICGWTAPCDILISEVETTTPTYTGANDGKAKILATSSAALSYSLDGINYQPDSLFSTLYPGTYIAYAKDINGCVDTFTFTINEAVNPFPEEYGYPWKKKVCRWFKLKIGSEFTPIREPMKWDAVSITGDRDSKWHGWNWQYSDGDVSLEFDCPAGKEVIDAEFQLKGNDAEVELFFGYTLDGVDYQLYQGKIDFNTYKRYAQKVTATVVRKDNFDLIQSRFEEKFTVNKAEDFSGNVIETAEGFDITLHGKEFATTFEYEKAEEVLVEKPDYFDTAGHLMIFDFSEPKLNEIQEFFGGTGLILSGMGTPYGLDLSSFKLINNGTYVISFDYDVSNILQNARSTGVALTDDYRMRFVFAWRREGVVTETIIHEVTGTIGANDIKTNVFAGNFSITLDLLADDEIFFFMNAENTDTSRRSRARFYQRDMHLTINAIETREDSQCKVWWLDDVTKYGIRAIGESNLNFKSRFIEKAGGNFATDGPMSLNVLTNGYNIRRFTDPERPLILSLKTILDSVQALGCVGMGLQKSGSGWTIRIEPIEFFYQDVLIEYIEEVADYSEEVAKELLYNSVEIGYEKYEEDGIQQLDEFNTKHEYSTPIKTNKNKLEIKSKFIRSGYSLEISRRSQFSKTSKDTVKNDEEPFAISVRRTPEIVPERNEPFETITNLISPDTAYNIRLSPKRMLLNWWTWLKGSFFYKQGTEKIKNTFVDRNGLMTTKFLVTEPNLLGDVNRDLLTEKDDVVLDDMGDGEPIFRPEWINIKCRLNPEQIENINRAMSGNDGTKDFGYMMVKKPDGVWQAFWIYKLTYNYATEKADIRGLKKWSTPAYPVAECCQWLTVNGCYVLVNGQRIIV